MILPDVINAVIASGRAFKITADGDLIVDAPLSKEEKRAARNRRYYQTKRLKASESVLKPSDSSESDAAKTSPSPTSPSPAPPSSPPPPPLSHGRTQEAGFALTTDTDPPGPKIKRFTPPSLADWQTYARSLDPPLPDLESENAWNFYLSKGWKVGNQAMKDWKAACRTYHGRWKQDARENSAPRTHANTRSHRQPPARSDTANKPGRYS